MDTKMKYGKTLQAAALATTLAVTAQAQHPQTPRVLMLVTSVDHFANGRSTGLWLEEFAVPYVSLTEGGAQVTVVSPKGGATPIDPHSAATAEQSAAWKPAALALENTTKVSPALHAADYDALFIPGGHGPLFDLAVDPQVASLISEFVHAGKPIASVCHGPAALLNATQADGTAFVKGKKLTAFSDTEENAAGLAALVPFSVQQRLTSLGAHYSQGPNFAEYAVSDGTLITGQNPASSHKVAVLLLEAIHTQAHSATQK
jgi:putative intracellular protease/amidase